MCVCVCVCVCVRAHACVRLYSHSCTCHLQYAPVTFNAGRRLCCVPLFIRSPMNTTQVQWNTTSRLYTHSTNSQWPLHTDIVSHTHTIAHTYTDKGYTDLSIVDKMSCHLRQSPDEPPAASLGESTHCELNSSICTPDLNHAATIPQCSELNPVVCIPCLYPQDANTHIGPTQAVSMLTWLHSRGVISCRTTVKAQLLHYS